ncbi:prolyl oligopeptidase family serine peptidase [Amphibacillus sediminis]|uniref:prolyl oligopeptidase family serine peptidase n=1 Tax=Amphibacillus sediminis TaxID=360185 RepID=UPI000833A927|nr:prolyl oligopeptidase family serine peptidase [Amphibacillus sediminis]
MIQVTRHIWRDIPVLEVVDQAHSQSKLPTLVYLHGITSAKEDNLTTGYLLAEQGYRVILPDAHLHGEREVANIDLRLYFFDIIQQSLLDLAVIKDQLSRSDLIEADRIGVAGTSMGAITTAAAMVSYNWIQVGALMMGTALLHDFAQLQINQIKEQGIELPLSELELEQLLVRIEQLDLSRQLDRLHNRSLFIWHGQEDQVIPFEHANDFYHLLHNDATYTGQVEFLSEANRGHKISRNGRLALVNWLIKSL